MRKLLSSILAVIMLIAATSAFAADNGSAVKSNYWIQVNKQRLRLTLYSGDSAFKSWPVAIGRGKGTVKTSRMDKITPAGVYKIYRVVQDASKLVYDPAWFDEPGEAKAGVYGSKLISFHNNWQIAIHGTNAPWSVGRRATHGCIRLRNRDIEDLVKYVKPGMKLVIVEKNGDREFYRETI